MLQWKKFNLHKNFYRIGCYIQETGLKIGEIVLYIRHKKTSQIICFYYDRHSFH